MRWPRWQDGATGDKPAGEAKGMGNYDHRSDHSGRRRRLRQPMKHASNALSGRRAGVSKDCRVRLAFTMHSSAVAVAAIGLILAASTPASAADVESLPGGETTQRATAQQCLGDLQTFDAELTRLGFGVLPPGGHGASQSSSGYYIWSLKGTPRQKMRARNLKDEKLGEVDDIVLNPEQRGILYVLASRGGFLGFSKKLVAIRWSDLRATEDHELYVLDVSAKAFEDAPAVDGRNFEKTADVGWQRTLGDYWDNVLRK